MPLVPVPPVRYRYAAWRVHCPFLLGAWVRTGKRSRLEAR
jgi:hypothetical protein